MQYACDQRDLIDVEIFEENSNKIKTSHTLETKRQDHINTILIVKPRLDVPLTLPSYVYITNSFHDMYTAQFIRQQL